MSSSSSKRVAVVTGGAQGLGYAIAKELLENEYRVCIADINEATGNCAAEEMRQKYPNSEIVFCVCDVSRRSQYIDLCENVLMKFARLDLIVNNAGILNESNPQKCIDVNLMGTIYGCEMAWKYMGKDKGGDGGMVINVSSLAGLLPDECLPVYSASKHGVVGLTRSYGTEYHYSKSGITFCALCPCAIKTGILETFKSTSLNPGVDMTQWDCLMEPSYVAKAAWKLIEID